MFKKLCRPIAMILLSALLLDTAFATEFTGIRVNIRIESFDRTIASGEVFAYTFRDALRAVCESRDIEISFDAAADSTQIYSINGIAGSYFGGVDRWMAYIERDGEIITGELMDAVLKEGDKLVVYYGEFTKTEILTAVNVEASGDDITFSAESQNANWILSNGKWSVNSSAKPVAGARINVRQPNGNYKILRTGADGTVRTNISQLGVYIYSAEKYNINDVPSIVASDELYYLHGLGPGGKATRAEAVAFIVNTYAIIKPQTVAEENEGFLDVPENHQYHNEIMLALNSGIISGTGEGFFMPDEHVNMASLCVMLCNALQISPDYIVQYKLIPEWAQKGVNGAILSGLLNNITFDWNGYVKGDTLITIYKNSSSYR